MNTIIQYRNLPGSHWRIRELRGFLVLLALSGGISAFFFVAMGLGV